MLILLVEDDQSLAHALEVALHKQGYSVNAVGTGKAALHTIDVSPPDLVILDLGLPDLEGRVVCQEIRASSNVPIIVVTARSEEFDRVLGLELGADDYVVKPFHFEEVHARVTALLRRSGGWASSELKAGPITLDMSRQEVVVGEEASDLTSFEYKIIEYLMVRAGQVMSKAELTDRLYDQDFERDSNVIEVFIGRLRKKLDPGNTLKPIETLRGRGYRFALERNQVD